MSKKLTLNAAGTEATIAEATLSDIVTTAFSTSEALTGTYGLAQKAAIFVGGMSFESYRLRGTLNPFPSA